MKVEFLTKTIIRDTKTQEEGVIFKDAVEIDGQAVYIPGHGVRASELMVALRSRSHFAAKIAFTGRDGVRRRSELGPFAREIQERGFFRTAVDRIPATIKVNLTHGEVIFTDTTGHTTDVPLSEEEAQQIKESALKVARSFDRQYNKIGLHLNVAHLDFGRDADGKMVFIDFPCLPDNSEITDDYGEIFDIRLVQKGDVGTFMERYAAMLPALLAV